MLHLARLDNNRFESPCDAAPLQWASHERRRFGHWLACRHLCFTGTLELSSAWSHLTVTTSLRSRPFSNIGATEAINASSINALLPHLQHLTRTACMLDVLAPFPSLKPADLACQCTCMRQVSPSWQRDVELPLCPFHGAQRLNVVRAIMTWTMCFSSVIGKLTMSQRR